MMGEGEGVSVGLVSKGKETVGIAGRGMWLVGFSAVKTRIW
jgi:hypothetical protein